MFRPTPFCLVVIVATSASSSAGPPESPLPKECVCRIGSTTFRVGHRPQVLLFSPDSTALLAASEEAVRLWDADPGRNRLPADLPKPDGRIAAAAFSPDGRSLLRVRAVSGRTDDWRLDCIDLTTGAARYSLSVGAALASGPAAFAPDGSSFVVPDGDETAVVRDPAGAEKGRVRLGNLDRGLLALSPDARLIATFP